MSTCLTRYPKHGASTQQQPVPFIIQLSKSTYTAASEQLINVTVRGTAGHGFKGLQMAAFKASNEEEAVGTFKTFDTTKYRAFTCHGGFKDSMITHINNNWVDSASLLWKPPRENIGDVIFKATVVEDFKVFWVDIQSRLNTSDQSNIIASSYQVTKPTALVSDLDFSGCGKVKGCFLYPSSCSGDDCLAAATFQYSTASNQYTVELSSNTNQKYISLGFSDDRYMGGDETITCVADIMSIQHGFNPQYFNDLQTTKFVSDVVIKYENGRIQCKFELSNVSSVYRIDQKSNDYKESSLTFDHGNPWYLQLAWGNVLAFSSVTSKHKERPPVSYSMISLKEKSIFRGAVHPAAVQAHVCLMMIAWMFLTGVVTVVSRHYRDWLPRTRWFDTKVWFQVHRALAVSVVLLTYLGIIIIFAFYGSEIRKGAVPHAYVGLAVVALSTVQIIAGMLRPNPDDKWRVYFNWGHRISGQLSHLLAAVTMFLGFGMEHMVQNMKTFGFTVLSIWLVGQIVWHIVYEFLSCRGKPLHSGDSKSDTDKDKEKRTSKLLTILLIVYAVFLAIMCIAGMVAFLIY